MELFIFPVGVLLLVSVALVIKSKLLNEQGNQSVAKKRSYLYTRKTYFMTRAENECYRALVQAIGDSYFIFAQVHLSTIIDEKIKGQDWRASRAHVNRKSVDFVLCDKDRISPVLAIELDDWSHARPDRQERDIIVEDILQQVGLPLLRVTNTQALGQKIHDKLSA